MAAFITGFIVGFVMGALQLDGLAVVGGIVGLATGIAYYVVFEVSMGATPGKRLLGLRVVGADGGNPTARESLTRNSFLLLGIGSLFGQVLAVITAVLNTLIAIALGVTISSNRGKRGFHDLMAGTSVTRT